MTEYDKGVENAEHAIIKALAGSRFRLMPWGAVRDLIREAARNVKIEAEKR